MPSADVEEKQKEHDNKAQEQSTWFAQEANAFPVPTRLSPIRKFQLQTSNRLLDIKSKTTHAMIYEVETGLGFNFVPVFIGVGIVTYFTIPAEPSMVALIITIGLLVLAYQRLKILSKLSSVLFAFAIFMTGMFLAQLATYQHQTPVIERQLTGMIQGVVLGVDRSSRGAFRYLISPDKIDDLPIENIPRRIRVSAASKHQLIKPGETITGLARLQPVSGPVYPGGYDFSFFSWHQGMGGSGFFMGKPAKTSKAIPLRFKDSAIITINRVRLAVESRVIAAMPDTTGKVAVALVTGNKTYIPQDVQETLRKTGLAHILAISGLHMALVTLTVIWIVRLALLAVPGLALNYPIKKWAVCTGFVSATTYLMLSGAGVATQRAWVMISVMLLAVLLDRRAITMRSVAISAIIILIINPQSLLSPGFQMSFAAVTALVAGYEFINHRKKLAADNAFSTTGENQLSSMGMNIIKYFGGIATTSLIAGTATAFIAAWHFHQVAPYGLLANLLAMPIVSILIMPFVLFSLILMPYGLEFLPLMSVSYGIEWVLAISRWVENISPNGSVGLLPVASMLLFAMFLVVLCFMKTRLRLLAFMPLAILPMTMGEATIPDVIIAENGRAVGVKTSNDELGLLFPRGSKFVHGIWLKAWSNGNAKPLNLPKEQCNRERCIYILPNSKVLHLVYNPDFINSSCKRADILVAPRLWWVNCHDRKPEVILKRYDFERFGTHALYIKQVTIKAENERKNVKINSLKSNIEIETSLPIATRPWHRRVTHPDDVSDTGE